MPDSHQKMMSATWIMGSPLTGLHPVLLGSAEKMDRVVALVEIAGDLRIFVESMWSPFLL